MLFDDGMEVEDLESLDASKDHVTLSDLMDALETKYDLLREKLLLEMANLSSGLCQQLTRGIFIKSCKFVCQSQTVSLSTIVKAKIYYCCLELPALSLKYLIKFY